MKMATAHAEFADLRGNNQAIARATASNAGLAAGRAVRNLFNDSKVKGKRIHSLNVTIVITTPEPVGIFTSKGEKA